MNVGVAGKASDLELSLPQNFDHLKPRHLPAPRAAEASVQEQGS